jgi:hypothetical protein
MACFQKHREGQFLLTSFSITLVRVTLLTNSHTKDLNWHINPCSREVPDVTDQDEALSKGNPSDNEGDGGIPGLADGNPDDGKDSDNRDDDEDGVLSHTPKKKTKMTRHQSRVLYCFLW